MPNTNNSHAIKIPLLFLGGVARIALCAAGPGRFTALEHSDLICHSLRIFSQQLYHPLLL